METRYLFKAKRVDNGAWVTGYIARYGYTGREKYYIIPSYASDLYSFLIDKDTICQCTGLKDKNGKLIWENDICKYQWNGKTKIDVIKYDPPMFSYSGAVRWNLDCDEVIGNKFDNPELLEV